MDAIHLRVDKKILGWKTRVDEWLWGLDSVRRRSYWAVVVTMSDGQHIFMVKERLRRWSATRKREYVAEKVGVRAA
jgi:hypothetical protein